MSDPITDPNLRAVRGELCQIRQALTEATEATGEALADVREEIKTVSQTACPWHPELVKSLAEVMQEVKATTATLTADGVSFGLLRERVDAIGGRVGNVETGVQEHRRETAERFSDVHSTLERMETTQGDWIKESRTWRRNGGGKVTDDGEVIPSKGTQLPVSPKVLGSLLFVVVIALVGLGILIEHLGHTERVIDGVEHAVGITPAATPTPVWRTQ